VGSERLLEGRPRTLGRGGRLRGAVAAEEQQVEEEGGEEEEEDEEDEGEA